MEYIFGIPGGAAIPIFDALVDSGVKLILTRHEQGVAHMADGYARATGKPGVVLVTSGPGATNTITGILTAHMDSVPMIVICGQQSTDNLGLDAFQEADVSGISYPLVKHSYLVKNAAEVPRIIPEAFFLARSGRPGPVLIDMPKDVANTLIDPTEHDDFHLPGYNVPARGDPRDIELAAALLQQTRSYGCKAFRIRRSRYEGHDSRTRGEKDSGGNEEDEKGDRCMNGNGKSASVEVQSMELPPGVGTSTSSQPISGAALTNGNRASNLAKKHVISLYVTNKPDALIRIALLFARRGYDIDSLVVSEGHDPAFSHMNITATGDEKSLQQILQQLNKLVDVVHAKDHTGDDIVQRELALIKLHCTGDTRNEILKIAHVFKCAAVNLTDTTITLEITGETEKIDAIHRMLSHYGILEMVRTGNVLVARGKETTY